MSGLLNEIHDESARGQLAHGRLKRVLEAVGDTDRPELLKALADPSITSAAIARVLTRRGLAISADSIRRYRKDHGLAS